MTIDEAIKICEEDAERIGGNPQSDHHAERCRQLVKWLTELKEAKRLLKMAVESLRWLALHTEDSYGSCVIRDDNAHSKCDNCPLDNPEYTDCKWEYEAEALKLIGDESSGI